MSGTLPDFGPNYTIFCPGCGIEISNHTRVCPECKEEIDTNYDLDNICEECGGEIIYFNTLYKGPPSHYQVDIYKCNRCGLKRKEGQ